jgi:hypothetical protein
LILDKLRAIVECSAPEFTCQAKKATMSCLVISSGPLLLAIFFPDKGHKLAQIPAISNPVFKDKPFSNSKYSIKAVIWPSISLLLFSLLTLTYYKPFPSAANVHNKNPAV